MATRSKRQLKKSRFRHRRTRTSASPSNKTVPTSASVTIKAPVAKGSITLPQPLVLPDLMNETIYRKYLKEAEAEVRETRRQQAAGFLYRVFQLLH